MDDNRPPSSARRKYRWPRVVLAALLLALALAAAWISVAVKRARENRDFTPMPSAKP